MSDDEYINSPLPVMSEDDAKKWARASTEFMAQTAEVSIDQKTVRPRIQECTGKGGETAHDGRFVLAYSARSPLPIENHAGAVAKIRNMLEGKNYEIRSFQKKGGDRPAVSLNALNRENDFSITVDGNFTQDSLLFSVGSPCLLPPGVEQEQF